MARPKTPRAAPRGADGGPRKSERLPGTFDAKNTTPQSGAQGARRGGKKRQSKPSYRRLVAWMLAGLMRVSEVHRANGEILNNAVWLKVLANILSSVPPSNRRSHDPPDQFGLTPETLELAAKRCGLAPGKDDIETQVAETFDWRGRGSKRLGKPHTLPMRPDKIAKLLGITAAVRREARAWNLGAIDETRDQRREARQEEAQRRDESRRRDLGAKPRDEYLAANVLSWAKPWEKEGISRATWYRRRLEDAERQTIKIKTGPCATNKGAGPVRQVRVRQVPAQPIRERETGPRATNTEGKTSAAAGFALASRGKKKSIPGDRDSRKGIRQVNRSIAVSIAPALSPEDLLHIKAEGTA
jgi:hypothetical protein